MDKFEVTILGCGSATPTLQHNPSSQVINFRDKLFMIDCGEGTQLQFRKNRFRFGRLNRIFISHLHGDHCFGLIGLISTLSLLGRIGTLYIHALPELESILRPEINYFCQDHSFDVQIIPFRPGVSEVIYQDRSLEVLTLPLSHRVPCSGFLFREKSKPANLIPDMIDFYHIPVRELPLIKNGADFVTSEGIVVPNNRLVRPVEPSRSYAYCSDTAYNESLIPYIQGVDLLYHESTFLNEDAFRAQKTGHSTAAQAAEIALKAHAKKLMIGHFSARHTDNKVFLDEAKAIFENTILANEGLSVSV